jgi:RHS repeat-associated protein
MLKFSFSEKIASNSVSFIFHFKLLPIMIALILLFVFSVSAGKDYSYNSVEECQEGMCTLSLYLGTQFVEEDGIWKSIDEATSLKGSGIECMVVKEKEGDPDAECVDYNLTSVTVAIHNRKGIEIPVHYQQKGVATDDLEGRERRNSTVVHPKADNEMFTFPLLPDEVLHLGDESTTISLIDSTFKREFGTTFTVPDWPDYNFGDYTNNYVCNYSDYEHRMFIKINTSKIPIASAILSANLSMKVYRPIYSPKTVNVTLHRIYNNYTIEKKEWLTGHQNGLQADEFDMTWNRMPSNLFFDPVPGSSHLFISTDRFWVRWDVTSMLQQEIDQNNRDFSIIALADPLTDPCDDYYYLTLYSEEYVSNAPYLTVEYTNFTDFASYLYDYAGNLIKDSEYYYQYNSYNQLERVRINNASGIVLEQYYYDENGDRAIKVHYFNSTVNETVYYYGDYVRVVNASGVFDTVEFYHGDKLIAERKNDSTMLFFHPDHLGSTSLITNSTGGIVEETFYEPFGAVISGGNQSRFDYTGKETDLTDLEYFGARYYNPQIGKWTQPDALIQNIYDPQSLNRYAFVRNNPYTYVDPDGHKPTVMQSYYNAVRNLNFPDARNADVDNFPQRVLAIYILGQENKKEGERDLYEVIYNEYREIMPDLPREAYVPSLEFIQKGKAGIYYKPRYSVAQLEKMKVHSTRVNYYYTPLNENYESSLDIYSEPQANANIAGSGSSGSRHKQSGHIRTRSGHNAGYSIDSNDKGEITGGSVAGFQMDAGFAKKLKEALDSKK